MLGCASSDRQVIDGKNFKSKYKIGALLGSGGNASVYSATTEDDTEVAVKIFDRSKLTEQEEIGILDEFRIANSLHHPNIIKTLEMFKTRKKMYIVMEKIDGGELFNQDGGLDKFSEQQAREMSISILNGIKYLHDRHIVHRDLKPENILVADEFNLSDLRIIDFGYAVEVDGFKLLARWCGTPAFIPPEILKDVPYGKPCDLWSFGITLYMLLSGTQPFLHANPKKLHTMICESELTFPEHRWVGVSDEVKNLISNLLIKDQYKRFTVEQALNHPWVRTDSVLFRKTSYAKTPARRRFIMAVRRVMELNRSVKLNNMLKQRSQRMILFDAQYMQEEKKKEMEQKYAEQELQSQSSTNTIPFQNSNSSSPQRLSSSAFRIPMLPRLSFTLSSDNLLALTNDKSASTDEPSKGSESSRRSISRSIQGLWNYSSLSSRSTNTPRDSSPREPTPRESSERNSDYPHNTAAVSDILPYSPDGERIRNIQALLENNDQNDDSIDLLSKTNTCDIPKHVDRNSDRSLPSPPPIAT